MHLPENWECIRNVLGNIHCIENRWSMFSMARTCFSRMYRLIRPIIFSEQIFLVLWHWKFVPVIRDRKRKYVKENVPGSEFQESKENFSAAFKQKVAEIESLEDLKIIIFREFEVAKCFKGGEILLNDALNWTKIFEFLTTNPKNTQAVNKVKCGGKKSRSYTSNGVERQVRKQIVAGRKNCESRNYVPWLFLPWKHPVSQ